MKDDGLNCLPQEIMLNVLSRLPAESVLDCRLICRAWRDLLQFHDDNNYFAKLHLRQQLIQQEQGGPDSYMMNFIVMSANGVYTKPRVLYYVKYHDQGKNNINDKQQPNFLARKINVNFTPNSHEFVGSSNGLICLSVMEIYRYYGGEWTCGPGEYPYTMLHQSFEQSIYICNPVTREFVILPKTCFNPQGYSDLASARVVYGFGYHPLTDEYKVVRICFVGDWDKPRYFKGLVEVYTLGSGEGWRSKRPINYYSWPSIQKDRDTSGCAMGVCVDGAVHWLPKSTREILVFDLAEERFYCLPTPPWGHFTVGRVCVIIRGWLSLVYEYFDRETNCRIEQYDFWFLEKNTEEYGKKQYYMSPNWVSGRSLPTVPWIRELFAKTRSGEYLYVENEIIFCYNLDTKSSRKLGMLSKNYRYWGVPKAHINSFVSLKALGESNVNIHGEDDKVVPPGCANLL